MMLLFLKSRRHQANKKCFKKYLYIFHQQTTFWQSYHQDQLMLVICYFFMMISNALLDLN